MKRRPKILVGKPGLDGHSNGAEQIAVRARDIGFEVVYDGIRSTPEQLVGASIEEGVHMIGLSILSGSHVHLVKKIVQLLKKNNRSKVPVVVGGIIPPIDARKLISIGVKAVHYDQNDTIINDSIILLENSPIEGYKTYVLDDIDLVSNIPGTGLTTNTPIEGMGKNRVDGLSDLLVRQIGDENRIEQVRFNFGEYGKLPLK